MKAEPVQKIVAALWRTMVETSIEADGGVGDSLAAAEILASILRRSARDLGVSKGDVETLRVAASSTAGDIYEQSGGGRALRAFRDAAKEDKEYTAQQRAHAKGIADEAIADAIRKVKQP